MTWPQVGDFEVAIGGIENIADLPVEASTERSHMEECGLKSTIAIPMIREETVVGAVGFSTFRQERRWPSEMIWRLRLVAEIIESGIQRHQHAVALRTIARAVNQMAPACAGAELKPNAMLRRRAIELIRVEHQERRRLSDVLHEDVMQMLVGMKMYMESLREAGEDQRSDLILRTESLIRDALNKLRKLVAELRPRTLSKPGGIVGGLQWLANQMFQIHGLPVKLRAVAEDIEPLDEDLQEFLYGAARKLLDNIVAQSQKNSAIIELRRLDTGHVQLVVHSEETAFDMEGLDDIPRESFELFSIREQAELFGGHLEVVEDGQGTSAVLTLPT